MQARHWVFTINNPGEDLIDGDAIPDLKYMVYQQERGENGTNHYQGYLEFSKPKRLGALKKIFKTAHFELRKGTRDEARDYCMKEDTRVAGPFEWGTWREEGKKRKERAIDTFKAAIDEGKSDKELWDSHPWQYLTFHRALGNIRLLSTSGRDWEMEVEYILGQPGVGKSKTAMAENPGAYWKSPNHWWDGYQGHTTVVMDEFSGKWFRWEYLLKILDRYPMNVEIKGGTVPFLAKKIVITSNRAPWELYNRWKFPLQALFRRITTYRLLEGTTEDPLETKVANISALYQLVTGLDYEDWLVQRPPPEQV